MSKYGRLKNPAGDSDLHTLSRRLLTHRWLVVAGIALTIFAFELIEHSLGMRELDVQFVAEVIVIALIIPITGGLIMDVLAKRETHWSQLSHQLKLEHWIGQQLTMARDWHELSELLTDCLQRIAPFAGISLLSFDARRLQFETVMEWRDPQAKQSLYPSFLTQPAADLFSELSSLHRLAPLVYPDVTFDEACVGYCLPLKHGRQALSLLHLYLPQSHPLTSEQIDLLNNLNPVLTFVIMTIRQRGVVPGRENAGTSEQRRLARYLHDTVGQSLSFIILRLNALQESDSWQLNVAVREEMLELIDMANLAFEQIRMTLTSLDPRPTTDLSMLLYKQALLSNHGQPTFNVQLTNEGTAWQLPSYVKQKSLSIFREAIINIQKHAQAHNVHIAFHWLPDGVTISVADDGVGFDFQTVQDDHFGLQIMKERAEEMNGRLSIRSSPGNGTAISVKIPATLPEPTAVLPEP